MSTASSSSSALTRSRSLRKATGSINSSSTTSIRSSATGGTASASASASASSLGRNDSVDVVQHAPRTVSPSRLPVKGMLSSASLSSGGEAVERKTTGSNKPPLSGGLLGRLNSTRKPTTSSSTTSTSSRERNTGTVAEQSRPLRTRSTTTSTPTPGASSSTTITTTTTRVLTTRSSSSSNSTSTMPASRPTTSSGLPPGPRKPSSSSQAGHKRTKSSTLSATTLTSSTILRPPSTTSSAGSSTTERTEKGRTRPPISRDNVARGHRRQLSNPSNTTTTPAAASGLRKASNTSTDSNVTTSAHVLTRKPAFTTLQQHYSPAKNLAPKPLTATFLAPPSPSKLPANVAISAETSRLQTELLQLHLLHRDSGEVDTQWRDSARTKLSVRFAEVVQEGLEVGKLESEQVERSNVSALLTWAATSSISLDEKIQVLDNVLCGIWSLGEPGGKYARVVRRFERWVDRMVDISESRKTHNNHLLLEQHGDGELVLVSVGELETTWKDECAALVRRLHEWRRLLKEVVAAEVGGESKGEEGGAEVNGEGEGEGGSSLQRILAACKSLVNDMLSELDIMSQIERDAIAQEMEWIRGMNRDTRDEKGQGAAGAIWRVL